jgi:hypothetical protein
MTLPQQGPRILLIRARSEIEGSPKKQEGKAMPGKLENGGGPSGSRWRIAAWAAVVALILMIPVVAMQFSDEWNWDLFDFVFAGTLLFGAALTYELVAKKGGTTAYRAAVGVAVVTAVALVWVNAAVGIIGDDESFNVMYFGVLAIGIAGALIARLKPQGMARALLAMAIAQMLVPLTVLALPSLRGALWEPPGPAGVFVLNAFFAMLWIGSAWLFRKAGSGALHLK